MFDLPYKVAQVEVGKLFIDRDVVTAVQRVPDEIDNLAYQRDKTRLVQEIVSDFNPLLFQPLTVNKREDGRFAVLDGGTRLTALIEMGTDPTQKVWCSVYEIGRRQEIELFYNLNVRRKGLTRFDKFKAMYQLGVKCNIDTRELVIEKTLNSKNYSVIVNGQFDKLTSIHQIEQIYNMAENKGPEGAGALALTNVASLVREYGNDTTASTRGAIWLGLGLFLNERNYVPARLKKALMDKNLAWYFNEAIPYSRKGAGSIEYARRVAEMIASMHNRNLKESNRSFVKFDWLVHSQIERVATKPRVKSR